MINILKKLKDDHERYESHLKIAIDYKLPESAVISIASVSDYLACLIKDLEDKGDR